MTRILAIDPGSEKSAWVTYDTATGLPDGFALDVPNEELLGHLAWNDSKATRGVDEIVIEWMQPRGMSTSAQEFETLFWIGRFFEAARRWRVHRLARLKVKTHICGSVRANDSNIIAALTDRYGGVGGRRAAVGLKAAPGPLYGVTADVWQALGLAITFAETVL